MGKFPLFYYSSFGKRPSSSVDFLVTKIIQFRELMMLRKLMKSLVSMSMGVALSVGSINAFAQSDSALIYAELPEISGPFNEVAALPSIKNLGLLKTKNGDVVLLPTSISLITNKQYTYRVRYNIGALVQLVPGPSASLQIFAQADIPNLKSVMRLVSESFPNAKIGRPQIAKEVEGQLVMADIFLDSYSKSVLGSGPRPSITDALEFSATLKPLFMRAVTSNGDLFAIRINYQLLLDQETRSFLLGASFALDCRASPRSFLDLFNMKHGCPEIESWKRASSPQFADQLSKCASQINSITSDVAPPIADRWRQWGKEDCSLKLLSNRK